MDKIFDILINGVGGQGVILASDIICLAAMYDDNDAKKSEIHGMSQRGGSVFSHIRYGEKIFSPVISKGESDIIISFEEMEILRWLEYANSQTILVILQNRILPANCENYPEGIEDFIKEHYKNALFIDPVELAEYIVDKKYINTAILGIASGSLNISADSWYKAIEKTVPPATIKKNHAVFEQGRTYLANFEERL